MGIAVLVSGAFAYCFFLSLISPLFRDQEKIEKRLKGLREDAKQTMNEELSKPFAERFIKPLFSKFLKNMGKVSAGKNNESMSRVENDLRLAGIYMGPDEFVAVKRMILFACIGFGLVMLFFSPLPPFAKLMTLLFSLILGILVPRYYLQAKIKKRQNAIRRQMPDILDLLSVSVEAGLGFDAALLRVSEQAQGPLIEELKAVYREIQMGRPRRDALKSLGERSTVEELKTFSGAMVQAEQLGISIRNVLRSQAQQLRLKRRQNASEKAMKAPVKMMLPLVIFIFPVIFIILLGPSLIKIMNIFAG